MKSIIVLIVLMALMGTAGAGNYQLPVSNATGMITFANNTKLSFGTFGHAGSIKYLSYVTSGNYFDIGGDPLFSGGFGWTGTAAPTSGSDLVAAGGASDIDYSMSSGIFTSPGGINTLSGEVTASKNVTVNAGKNLSTSRVVYGITTTSANVTLDASCKDLYFVGIKSAAQHITLPASATMTGRILRFIAVCLPGGHDKVELIAASSEKINGLANVDLATQYASLTIANNGTAWTEIAHEGTIGTI